MNKFILAVLIALLLASCHKEKVTPPSIIGKWNLRKFSYHREEVNFHSIYDTVISSLKPDSNTLEFNNDGLLTVVHLETPPYRSLTPYHYDFTMYFRYTLTNSTLWDSSGTLGTWLGRLVTTDYSNPPQITKLTNNELEITITSNPMFDYDKRKEVDYYIRSK